ncbi:MAG: MoaD/ThiS family protein [Bacillota bacterium]
MAVIDVRAFGKLYFLFREREWDNPLHYEIKGPLSADELREKLEIPAEDVEAVFINRVIKPLSTTLGDGDRVAFVPPGVPSIHRFNLGFYDVKEKGEQEQAK